jgi:hypothetical protein
MKLKRPAAIAVGAAVLTVFGLAVAKVRADVNPYAVNNVVDIQNGNWKCNSPQDGTLVIVHNATRNDGVTPTDAVHLGAGCTGRIAAIIVLATAMDGIKVGEGAYDLRVESGLIECSYRTGGAHQDGVQAMGGRNVTFENLKVVCPSGNNGAFFVNKGTQSAEVPTNIVCDTATCVRQTRPCTSGSTRSRAVLATPPCGSAPRRSRRSTVAGGSSRVRSTPSTRTTCACRERSGSLIIFIDDDRLEQAGEEAPQAR